MYEYLLVVPIHGSSCVGGRCVGGEIEHVLFTPRSSQVTELIYSHLHALRCRRHDSAAEQSDLAFLEELRRESAEAARRARERARLERERSELATRHAEAARGLDEGHAATKAKYVRSVERVSELEASLRAMTEEGAAGAARLSAAEAEQVLNDCKQDMLDLGLDPTAVC